MGELLLVGPSPLEQHRTCISGHSCEFDGFLGKHISSENQILLADTCGIASLPTALQIASVTAPEGISGIVGWELPLYVAGGTYRLCWCSGEAGTKPCYAAEDFRTDVGSLTMIGVSPLQQDKTCVSGLPCEIDGLTGTHVSDSDEFLVLETCGLSGAVVEGFPGLASFDGAGSSGGRVTWGALPITAAGGRYALCWCHSPGAHAMASEFQCSLLAFGRRVYDFFSDLNSF